MHFLEIFEVDGRLYDPFYDQIYCLMEWIEDTMKYSTGTVFHIFSAYAHFSPLDIYMSRPEVIKNVIPVHALHTLKYLY